MSLGQIDLPQNIAPNFWLGLEKIMRETPENTSMDSIGLNLIKSFLQQYVSSSNKEGYLKYTLVNGLDLEQKKTVIYLLALTENNSPNMYSQKQINYTF